MAKSKVEIIEPEEVYSVESPKKIYQFEFEDTFGDIQICSVWEYVNKDRILEWSDRFFSNQEESQQRLERMLGWHRKRVQEMERALELLKISGGVEQMAKNRDIRKENKKAPKKTKEERRKEKRERKSN